MKRKPTYPNPPVSPMNQWVRDALEYAEMSYPRAAAGLAREMKKNFDRSTVQKMTVGRKVSMAEAEALSKITGFPVVPPDAEPFPQAKYQDLLDNQKKVVKDLIDVLAAENESKRR
jgi:hypothetical protein